MKEGERERERVQVFFQRAEENVECEDFCDRFWLVRRTRKIWKREKYLNL